MKARRRLCAFAFFGLLGATAFAPGCSGSFDGVPLQDDAAVSAKDGGRRDAAPAKPDVAAPPMDRDAGECHALEPTSPPTTPQSKAGAKPTPRGGAVRDGRFDLTETNVFGNQSVPVTIQSAMEIDAGKFRTTSRILGATSRLSGNYKPQERKSA